MPLDRGQRHRVSEVGDGVQAKQRMTDKRLSNLHGPPRKPPDELIGIKVEYGSPPAADAFVSC
jgi:hypothetical protein